MNSHYDDVIEALAKKGILAEFHRPHQLVLSYRLAGRIWITHDGQCWLISTWAPACYLVPTTSDIVDVCTAG
jgi:hypothetical protein